MRRANILMALVMIVATFFVGTFVVDAATSAPSSLVINYTTLGSGNNPLSIAKSFNVKKTSNGKYVYCTDYAIRPANGRTYNKVSETTDLGLAYIINSGYNDKNDSDFFITQAAVWLYLDNKGLMSNDTTGTIELLRSTVYDSSNNYNSAAKEIRSLVANANSATKETAYLEITTDTVSFELSEDGRFYISNLIRVNTNLESYEVSFENAPEHTFHEKTNGGMVVYVSANKMDGIGADFAVKVTGSKDITKTYTYKTSGSYQPIAAPYVETTYLSDSVDVDIEGTALSISKRDSITGRFVSGATLVLRNEQNVIVETWVSDYSSHVIENLPLGKYTLTEKYAPEGYERADSIEFEITEFGTTKSVTMYNKPINVEYEDNYDDYYDDDYTIQVPVEPTSSFASSAGIIIGLIVVALGSVLIFRSTKSNAR